MLVAGVASLALTAAAASSDWVQFDRRSDGLLESPAYYDASRIERQSSRIEVWIERTRHYFGRNDSTVHFRYQIDCVQRMSRVLVVVDFNEDLAPPSMDRRRVHEPLRPIEDDSLESALAARVCPTR